MNKSVSIYSLETKCMEIETINKNCLGILSSLEDEYISVSSKTNSLHALCKRLLQKQQKLDAMVEQLEQPLSTLSKLERFNQKQFKFSNFFKSLADLEEIFDFFVKSEYEMMKERGKYLKMKNDVVAKYVVCLYKYLLTLFEKIANNTIASFSHKMSDLELQNALYLKYLTAGKEIKNLCSIFEERINIKYFKRGLWNSYFVYCEHRERVLRKVLEKTLFLLDAESIEESLRKFSRVIVDLCLKEHKLFGNFFELNVYNEIIAERNTHAFEHLLNVDSEEEISKLGHTVDAETVFQTKSIISNSLNTHYSVLREFRKRADISERDCFGQMIANLSTIYTDHIRKRTLLVDSLDSLCDQIRMIETEIIENQIESNLDAKFPLLKVFGDVVKDTQERLFFICSDYVNEELTKVNGDQVVDVGLTLLSKLYTCLEFSTFKEVLDSVVTCCLSSILSFSLNTKDKALFRTKHLLKLREQVSPFLLPVSSEEQSIEAKFQLDIREIMRTRNFVSVTKKVKDGKKLLDNNLRLLCDQLITTFYQDCLGKLLDIIADLEADLRKQYVQMKSGENGKVKGKAGFFQDPKLALSTVEVVLPGIQEALTGKWQAMEEAFQDIQTQKMLFEPIRANVFAKVTQFQDLVQDQLSDSEEKVEIMKLVDDSRAAISSLNSG
eukprot:maker-scaffold_41-snap-gene-1.30-mRNA-1 protein AED:0.00 eAED:0.00 QI:60/1/1/1/0.5/0.4/5/40/666